MKENRDSKRAPSRKRAGSMSGPLAAERSGGVRLAHAALNPAWFTGRFIIVFVGGTPSEASSSLSRTSGLKVASSSDFGERPAEMPAAPGSALMLEALGIAIADAPPEQLRGLGVAAANNIVVVPERRMFTAGSLRFDTTYLEGYRDGVNATIDNLLAQRAGGDDASRSLGFIGAARTADEFTWNLERTGAAASRFTGKGVKIAILDTGFDQQHPDFAGRISMAQSFVPGSTVQDVFGHGTHCLGIAGGILQPLSTGPRYGCASGAELWVAKVMGDDGQGDEAWVLNGLDWAIRKGADIVSISLEGPYNPASPTLPQYEAAGSRALQAGCLLIAAAGNYSARPLYTRPVASPACASTVMSVAAIGADDRVAAFSCAGTSGGAVDLSAPGVTIESSFPTPRQRKTDSGTSMAAPLVAGLAALHMEASPGLRGRALWDKLLASAAGLPDGTADVGVGCAMAP